MYSSGEIGAVGAISNYAGNKQQIGVSFNTAEEYVQFGNQNNVVAKESDITRFYEERVRLCGFAMLIKRDVWNKAGGMDEDFSPGYFEDDDLSMKILRQGKRLLVCTNSFIYHAGSVGFSKNSKKDQIIAEHYQTFYNKHRFPILDYAYADNYKLDEIRYGIDEKTRGHLAEEMADVLICIELLKNMYGVSENELTWWVKKKQNRINERMEA